MSNRTSSEISGELFALDNEALDEDPNAPEKELKNAGGFES